MEELNAKLDELLREFFAKIEELQSAKSALANAMKNGFHLMSKARYSMGNKSVGSLQYGNKMEATVKVITKDEFPTPSCEINEEKTAKTFHLRMDDSYKGEEGHQTSENNLNSENVREVRRRKVRSKEGSYEKDLLDSKKAEGELTENVDKRSVKKLSDPLKWFGVLVPSCLRQCQQEFKSSCQLLCEIAELECKVNRIVCSYNKLKELKYALKS